MSEIKIPVFRKNVLFNCFVTIYKHAGVLHVYDEIIYMHVYIYLFAGICVIFISYMYMGMNLSSMHLRFTMCITQHVRTMLFVTLGCVGVNKMLKPRFIVFCEKNCLKATV